MRRYGDGLTVLQREHNNLRADRELVVPIVGLDRGGDAAAVVADFVECVSFLRPNDERNTDEQDKGERLFHGASSPFESRQILYLLRRDARCFLQVSAAFQAMSEFLS